MAGRTLVLWRHGRTSWNSVSRFQGQEDVPLDEVGFDQVRRAAQTLVGLQPTHIVSSDLSRALDTARALARLAELEVQVDPDLRETFAGQWQGLTKTELMERFASDYSAWGGDSNVRPGGGETRLEVAQRVMRAINGALTSVPDGGTLVVASHGGALRAGLGRLLALEPAQWTALGVLANAQWTVLQELDENIPRPPGLQWRLAEYNAGSLPEPVMGDDR
ncbi:MAG: histidine phosphatase family protein [Actinobacteria bacterium]|nr:histidine phosphatase family protein [Actinomycetota bacterium]NBY15872.1 histidine phosphatase family protein [Actinomycetota bacterium]